MQFSLLTFEGETGPNAGVLVGDRVFPLARLMPDCDIRSVSDLLIDWSKSSEMIECALAKTQDVVALPLSEQRLLSPLLRPGGIFCAGANYADHSTEMMRAADSKGQESKAVECEEPWHFIKYTGCAVGTETDVALPTGASRVDWEAELAVVIGKTIRNVSEERALDAVMGYAVANDLSARDLSRRHGVAVDSPFRMDWVGHKSFDGSCPLGPWITLANAVDDPQNLGIKLWVNDELMQDSSTSKMVHSVARQISYLSRNLTLHAGDVILTGTPSGVGMGRGRFLKPGDVITVEIEGLGRIRNRMVQLMSTQANDKFLISGACVLTMDKDIGDLARGDILVRGAMIEAVGDAINADEAIVIDGSEMIAIPGFVDTHRHIWQGALRNSMPDATLVDYFRTVMGRMGPVYTPEDVYQGAYISALGALDAGVTTLLDWSHIQNSAAHSNASIRALADSGIRSVFAYGPPALGMKRWWEEKGHGYPERLAELREDPVIASNSLISLALAMTGPEYIDVDNAARAIGIAREQGLPMTVHVGIGAAGMQNKLLEWRENGLMGPDITYVHCTTLSDAEWDAIAETGGAISLSSPIEMQMGHGLPPIQKALDHGIRPSLSVDVETSIAGDMFTQMRSVLSLQRAAIHQRALEGEEDLPALLTARDVLEFATVEGARTLGLDDSIGSLTAGKQADIVLLRKDRLNVMPLNNAIGAVVTGMDTGNIDTVMVAGRIVKEGGRLPGVDLATINNEASKSRDRIFEASGVPFCSVCEGNR